MTNVGMLLALFAPLVTAQCETWCNEGTVSVLATAARAPKEVSPLRSLVTGPFSGCALLARSAPLVSARRASSARTCATETCASRGATSGPATTRSAAGARLAAVAEVATSLPCHIRPHRLPPARPGATSGRARTSSARLARLARVEEVAPCRRPHRLPPARTGATSGRALCLSARRARPAPAGTRP